MLKIIAASLLFFQAAGGSIGITVVDVTTGQPIADTRIELTKLPAPLNVGQTSPPAAQPAPQPPGPVTSRTVVRIPPVTSDANGHYSFPNLELGAYLVRVLKEGYAEETTSIGSNSSSAQVILAEKDSSKSLVFRLTPGAAINGRVDGPDGKPVGNMEVAVFVPRYDAEGRESFLQTAYATTDDRGEYRIYPVNPGQYYLGVGPPTRPIPGNRLITPFNNPKNQYPRVFYPGAADPKSASIVDVRPRADLKGMDFRLSVQSTFRIRGHVVDTLTGKIPENVGISIIPRETNINTNSTSSANIVNPTDGSFELQNIAPGRYVIRAQTTLVLRPVSTATNGAPGVAISVQPTVTPGVAAAAVDVTGGDVDGVVLAFVPPITISGKLVMQNGAAVPAGTRANIVLRGSLSVPILGSAGTPRWNPDGTFTLEGVAPGEYSVSVTPIRTGNTARTYVRDVRAGEIDLLSHSMVIVGTRSDEIVITLGQNGGQISGTVNRPSVETSDRVVLVPDERGSRNLYMSTSIAQNGSFTLQGVSPGRYKVFALAGVVGTPWFDAAYLSTIDGSGSSVTVSDSANVSVNLNIIRRP